MSELHRRKFLTISATVGVAGCLSRDGDSGQTTLGYPLINNRHEQPHTVDFRVTWNGDVVHNRTYQIEANGPDDNQLPGAVPGRTWPDDPGKFTVSARLDGGEWRTVDPADQSYPECLGVTVEVDPRGRLAMKTGQNPMLCSEEFAGNSTGSNDTTEES